ncbi:MAG: hypothetical protein Q9165_006577 [Trypethelium subeluteriae]
MAPITRSSQPPATFSGVVNGLKNPSYPEASTTSLRATDNLQSVHDPITGLVHEDLQPILNMAERVEKEVESFAEKLDQWNNRRQEGRSRENALGLLDDCKRIADQAVRALKKKHGADRSKRAREVWDYRADSLKRDDRDKHKHAMEIQRNFPKSTEVKELERWQEESDTWGLLRIILSGDAFLYYTRAEFEKLANDPKHKTSDSENLWEDFLARSPLAREQDLILKWLESTAEHTGDDVSIMAERLEEKAGRSAGTWSHGFLDTREQIKGAKRFKSWNMSEADPKIPAISDSTRKFQIVSTLDPDSKFREGKSLEENDDFFERSLWLACWELLRRGRPFKEVREWCAERHENWRSISLGAASTAEKQSLSVQNIFNYSLWRRTCVIASRNFSASEHEQAVYGLLGGNSPPIEAISRSWDDHLYANFKAIITDGFEDYLRAQYPDKFSEALNQLPIEEYLGQLSRANPEMLSVVVVENLTHDKFIQSEARKPSKIIQGSFINHQPMALVSRLSDALAVLEGRGGQVFLPEKGLLSLSLQNPMLAFATDPNALRIMAHVVLILQDLDPQYLFDSTERVAAADHVLVGYIELLKRARKLELIPLYASRLRHVRPESILGRILPIIQQPHQREYIKLLRSYDLDVLGILTAQYEWRLSEGNLANSDDQQFQFDLLEPADPKLWPGQRIRSEFYRRELKVEELDIIRSLEWFLLVDGHWIETFAILTSALKTFLHLKTVRIFGAEIDIWSEDITEEAIISHYHNQFQASRKSRLSLEQQLKVFAALKWQSRTYRDLELLANTLKALHAWRELEDKELEHGIAGLQRSARTQFKSAYNDVTTYLPSLLKNDWLKGGSNCKEQEHRRIRNTYLPPIILAYNSVLSIAAQFLGRDIFIESIELVNTIASGVHNIKAATKGSELAMAFLETHLMGDLVTSMACMSALVLKCNDQAAAMKGRKPKKRGPNGETLSIWDPYAPMCPDDES